MLLRRERRKLTEAAPSPLLGMLVRTRRGRRSPSFSLRWPRLRRGGVRGGVFVGVCDSGVPSPSCRTDHSCHYVSNAVAPQCSVRDAYSDTETLLDRFSASELTVALHSFFTATLAPKARFTNAVYLGQAKASQPRRHPSLAERGVGGVCCHHLRQPAAQAGLPGVLLAVHCCCLHQAPGSRPSTATSDFEPGLQPTACCCPCSQQALRGLLLTRPKQLCPCFSP